MSAHLNRGAAYGNLKCYQEAISDWKEAIRIGEQTGNKEAVRKATANLAKLAKPK